MRQFVLIMCLVLLSGCATTAAMYPGRERPDSKLATIKMAYGISVRQVDGNQLTEKLGETGKIAPFLGYTSVKVLPGSHTIEVNLYYQEGDTVYYSNTPQVVRLHARAGKQYVIYPIIERGIEILLWKIYCSVPKCIGSQRLSSGNNNYDS